MNETKVNEQEATKNYKRTDPRAYIFTKHVHIFIGASKIQDPKDLSEESSTKVLGNACETSDECTENAECFGKVCVCEKGYSGYSGLCKLGTFWRRGLYSLSNLFFNFQTWFLGL
jgi:hypothetical protein